MNKQSDTGARIIVIDDDPTGSQTVHSCPLLMTWDVDRFVSALRSNAPGTYRICS